MKLINIIGLFLGLLGIGLAFILGDIRVCVTLAVDGTKSSVDPRPYLFVLGVICIFLSAFCTYNLTQLKKVRD